MNKRSNWGYLFTLPYTINLMIFFFLPIVFSLYIAFTEWDFFNQPKWNGLDNWKQLFVDQRFWGSVRNILLFTVIFVPLQTLFALCIAHLLNLSIRLKALFRVAFFLPVITPWIAGGLLWVWIYNYQFGILNWLLNQFNVSSVNWLDHDKWWIVIGSIALVNVWKGIGSSMILLLAGMQNVPKELKEAASIDGASGIVVFVRIILPLVSPMIYLVMILSTISAFQAFDVFLVMSGNSLQVIPDRTIVPNILIYREAFVYSKMGIASTMAWILFLIIMMFTVTQRILEKRWVHYETN